ncbi:hypothetical protein HMPREF0063_13014 [Aeromicrobium marinum DSM 15272]|uniref:DUF4394 domain-containing protein n=1 Tax=Aeromicrobium marinum DSM 15272 TaxID=585531 RepID=E2SG55_9ACTN|nr:DUF4394 domain-containing protein [Aeromicrobium marinum]EFQ81812.1 hypothetical protein HMPREF0063_13014 [Aeromicrobium marinum DSM 15272]
MNRPLRATTLAGAAATLVVGVAVAGVSTLPAGASSGTSNTAAVGLSSDGLRLAEFKTLVPGTSRKSVAITGLVGDAKLIGIDQRVANGLLYGVGDAGGVYTLRGAKATKVSQLTVALQGTAFDVDFNPAADRLRIISNAGQSLRHNVVPDGVTAVDGSTAYTPGVITTGLQASAYTNNDVNGDTATTLYNIDAALDQLVMQVPANSGSLVAVGKLGIDLVSATGFDIDTELAGTKADENTAYLIGTPVGGVPTLYTINLLTGSVEEVGDFGTDIIDLAVVQG